MRGEGPGAREPLGVLEHVRGSRCRCRRRRRCRCSRQLRKSGEGRKDRLRAVTFALHAQAHASLGKVEVAERHVKDVKSCRGGGRARSSSEYGGGHPGSMCL